MKTPVEELFDKLWNTDKDKLTWYAIYNKMRQRESYASTDSYKKGWKDGYAAGLKIKEVI